MQKLINSLKKLKRFNAVAIKQSLEDEGASYEDLIVMKKTRGLYSLLEDGGSHDVHQTGECPVRRRHISNTRDIRIIVEWTQKVPQIN